MRGDTFDMGEVEMGWSVDFFSTWNLEIQINNAIVLQALFYMLKVWETKFTI